MVVAADGQLTGTRVALMSNGPNNLRVRTRGRVLLEDASIRGARGVGSSFAIGATSAPDGYLRLHRFVVEDNADVGLHQSEAGTIELVDGTVRRHDIGVLVPPEFDVSDILERVHYVDNREHISVQ